MCYVSKFAFLFYIYKLTPLKYGRNKKTQKEKLTTKIFEFEIFIVNLNCGFEISKILSFILILILKFREIN